MLINYFSLENICKRAIRSFCSFAVNVRRVLSSHRYIIPLCLRSLNLAQINILRRGIPLYP